MVYIYSVVMLATGYYSLTYGFSLWKDGSERLAGFGAILIALLGTIIPVVMLIKES